MTYALKQCDKGCSQNNLWLVILDQLSINVLSQIGTAVIEARKCAKTASMASFLHAQLKAIEIHPPTDPTW